MTVSSLWSMLEESGCGTPVGIDEFSLRGRGSRPEEQTILAVDLSIWICEGIASTALSSFHSEPALHLVFQRIVKLLKLGLGLVCVLDGDRRLRSTSSPSSHELRQRRSCSQFASCSRRCETLLQLLGVPVVRAVSEGEALCALLNKAGFVDGVISNDGDSFLYGAQTLYTSFTAENLEARKVIKFHVDNIVANLDANGSRTIKLSREDLVAFAMLTGSDLCGDGQRFVGHKKAIQFIHACRQCRLESPLDEVISWSDETAEAMKPNDVCIDCDDDGPSTIRSTKCSLCLHAGTKAQHQKHGCVECGTGPGECCFVVTTSEKVVRALKAKALGSGSITPHHRHIALLYKLPNDNTVPDELAGLKSNPYNISVNAAGLFNTSLLLKGRSLDSSKQHLIRTLPPLMARLDLWDSRPMTRPVLGTSSTEKYKPLPVQIAKAVTKDSLPCYEVLWSLAISRGQQIDFSTIECESIVSSKFPQVVKAFREEERRRLQARAHEERRRRFTGINTNNVVQSRKPQPRDHPNNLQNKGGRRKRERNFHVDRPRKIHKANVGHTPNNASSDVSMLMDNLQSNKRIEKEVLLASDNEHEFNCERCDETWNDAESDTLSDDDICVSDPTMKKEKVDEYYADANATNFAGNEASIRDFKESSQNNFRCTDGCLDSHDLELFPYSLDCDGNILCPVDYGCHQPYSPLPNTGFVPGAFCCGDIMFGHNESYRLTSNDKVFVDMGIKIEVTPITSRRRRLF